MISAGKHVVTGAFGYSGRYITRKLLEEGANVVTLTNSGSRSQPFGDRVKVHPLCFEDTDRLIAAMQGTSVLYNTYWVRFNRPGNGFDHETAVANSFILFDAARRAGVKRIVHISITNPSLESPFEYFRGKARIEERLKGSGVSYSILRPAVLFGGEDILVNNIVWTLRNFPVFGLPGSGQYRLQPIHVEDLATLAVQQGSEQENHVVNAVGRDRFTFRELVNKLGEVTGHSRPIVPMPLGAVFCATWLVGKFKRDVFLTRDELQSLAAGLLATDSPGVGEIRLLEWARSNKETLGRCYASELARRNNREASYDSIMAGRVAVN